jgi:ribosome-associated protein
MRATVTFMPNDVRDVAIRDDSIRLGQFLKLADLIDTGSDAKSVITDGLVTVNGAVEIRRGAQLRPGDTVSIGDRSARVSGGGQQRLG